MAFASRTYAIYIHQKRRPSTLDLQLSRISARATKCFDMPVCQQSARTFFGLPSWAWRLASFERRQRSPCALDVTAVLSLARGLFASLGRHLSLVPWVQANAQLSVSTQLPILTEKHLTRRVWNSMFFCAYVLHQLCALRSIRLCLATRWAKGVAVKTINLRTSERRSSTLAYKLARISARATSASTCLFANRLHALASKDMCSKPMTPKIQVAVELPATLMLLGDTEGWCCVSFALLSKRAPRRSCTHHRNAINQLGHQLMSVGGGRKKYLRVWKSSNSSRNQRQPQVPSSVRTDNETPSNTFSSTFAWKPTPVQHKPQVKSNRTCCLVLQRPRV